MMKKLNLKETNLPRYNPNMMGNRNPYKATIPFNRDSRMERLPLGKIFQIRRFEK